MSARANPRVRRVVVALSLAVLAAGYAAAGRAEAPQRSAPAPNHVVSIKDSPGYVPLVDPESTADVIGYRTSAPLVSVPLSGGGRTFDALGAAILRALHVNSVDSLRELCVTDYEFRRVLWRDFPQSRPAVGLQWQDAWVILDGRLHAGCSHEIRDYGGHYYEFVGVKADSVLHSRNFTLYGGITLTAKGDDQQTYHMRWLKGVVERKGHFKIYSTED